MGYCRLAVFARYRHLENAILIFRHRNRIPIPVVEIANEVCSKGKRSPFSVHDIAVVLHVEAERLISLVEQLATLYARACVDTHPCEFLQTSFCIVDCL